MLAVGTTATFFGYSVFYYGLTQVQGGNWGYLDLVWPSRWATHKSTPRDDGTAPVSAQTKTENQLSAIAAQIKKTGKITAKQKTEITKDLHALANPSFAQSFKNTIDNITGVSKDVTNWLGSQWPFNQL